MKSVAANIALAVAFGPVLAGCAQIQGRSQPLDGAIATAAKPADCSIDVYDASPPTRPFVKVARLDAHMEITHFLPISKDHLMPELKRQACLSGADAIIDIEEKRSRYLETNMYHLTATGIVYR